MAKGERAMVPPLAPSSYYGRPVLKAPTWRWPIPAYLFSGGLAAGTALVGAGARLQGDRRLADRATAATLGAVVTSTGFLIHDLGRPSRFHHMLRVAKPTSPMSVGTWIFSGFSGLVAAAAGAAIGERYGLIPPRLAGPARTGAQLAAGMVAPALATYTAVLVADTAVPSWHHARRELPWIFAGSAAASGGAAGVLLDLIPGPAVGAGAARRLALAGAAVELAGDVAMHRRLEAVATGDPDAPDVAMPLRTGRGGRLSRAARACTGIGAGLLAAAPRRRSGRAVGAVGLLAGAALERFAIVAAGRVSAADPAYTVGPQRAGLVPVGRST